MSPVFDYHASLARMGSDEGLLREMAALFLEDGPHRLQEACAGVNSHDAKRTAHAAHTLKGLAANFGALRAVSAAARLEDLARREIWEEMNPAAETLQQSVEELLRELRHLAKTTSPSGAASPSA